uniref:Uncharacterized protein n=1 Tax=Hyaloperonospora arabidopsidis (strain Emoy2) TaxID=559515 RepID=M4BUA4_HYAAE
MTWSQLDYDVFRIQPDIVGSGRNIARKAAWDSSGAYQDVKQQEKRHVVGIASEQASLAHGLLGLE